MPARLRRPKSWINFHAQRFTQISELHCGPAVVQMLLGNLGIEVGQEQVAAAGGAAEMIEENGMRVDQMAIAVRALVPQVEFWWKEQATLNDLALLIHRYRYPVGVEWQGLFEEDELAETGDSDYGHYSVVTHMDRRKRELIIADPYKDFIAQDRIFSFEFFDRRWWDYNEVIDVQTGQTKLVKDDHLLFILTPLTSTFPIRLGMKRELRDSDQ